MGAVTASGTTTYPRDMDPDYFYTAAVLCPDYYPNLFGGPPLPYLSSGIGLGGWAQNSAPGLGSTYWNGTTNEAINGTVSINVSTPLTTTFTYTGTGTPPDHVDMLVHGSVYAQAQSDVTPWNEGGVPFTDSELSATFSASDGLGESLLAQAMPSSPDSSPSPVSGSYLMRYPVRNGKVTVSPQVSVSEINLVPVSLLANDDPGIPQGPAGVNGNAGVSVTAKQDNREVSITCPTIEDSYYKGAYEPDHGTDKYDHLRDPITGAIVTDSAVAYQKESLVGLGGGSGTVTSKGWQVNNIAFTANAASLSSPSYAWSLSGPSEASLEGQFSNPVSYSLLEPDSNKFPLQGTLKVTVTDGDGASASNTFGITWHLPVETKNLISTTHNPKKQIDGPLNKTPAYPGLPPVTSDASEPKDLDIGAGIEGIGAIAAAFGQEEIAGIIEIFGKLANTVDLKYHYAGEPANSYTNNQELWNTCVETASQGANNVDDPTLLTMKDSNGRLNGFEKTTTQIFMYEYTLHKDWNADFYDIHGYTHAGEVYADPLDDPNGIKPEPYYTTQNQHTGP